MALIPAWLFSGLLGKQMAFWGFPPRKSGERQEFLKAALNFPGAVIFYDAPHRLNELLSDLVQTAPENRTSVVREISKIHQEVKRGSPDELLDYYRQNPARGEIVVVVEGVAARPVHALDVRVGQGEPGVGERLAGVQQHVADRRDRDERLHRVGALGQRGQPEAQRRQSGRLCGRHPSGSRPRMSSSNTAASVTMNSVASVKATTMRLPRRFRTEIRADSRIRRYGTGTRARSSFATFRSLTARWSIPPTRQLSER